jgi:hypothetical protein
MSAPDKKAVVVAGDAIADWNLARIRRSESEAWARYSGDHTFGCFQPSGAMLLGDLVQAVAAQIGSHQVHQPDLFSDRIVPGDERYNHSYNVWSLEPFDKAAWEKGGVDRNKYAWRVTEFLGLAPSSKSNQHSAKDDLHEADVVVLDDANLDFRHRRELWPNAIREPGRCRWVLLKTAWPVAQGTLFDHLHRHFAERLIVVMTVNDLRLTEVQISRELSWERTAQDLAWELLHNPHISALSDCAHVVVTFDTVGAFALSRPPRPTTETNHKVEHRSRLIFDPHMIEGMWVHNYPGKIIGHTTCLTAGIARQLLLSSEEPDLDLGIRSGLAAQRKLHQEGYAESQSESELRFLFPWQGHGGPNARPKGTATRLVFPSQTIAEALAADGTAFAVTNVQNPVRFLHESERLDKKNRAASFWTILQDHYSKAPGWVARQIVRQGAEVALQGVPLGQFGDLLTVDRREIESFRSIRALVDEYNQHKRPKRPLSIAVFGPPGSGKSFGIEQVAKALLPGQIEKLDFNLSQFDSPDELRNALHRVRDSALSGKVPLVFWDEFDTSLASEPLGWLRHFLVPMQDGVFQEGQITHPIGRAIFVFAGGTSSTMKDFVNQSSPKEQKEPTDSPGRDAQAAFRKAKGPDFVSRLKGYVNVMGPNPLGSVTADPLYMIRRAILLRSILRRDAKPLFSEPGGNGMLNIDSGVLRALLEVPEYKHGVRSMESLIAMSRLGGRTRFERSSLPAELQLDLHVDAQSFLALVQQIVLTRPIIERLARVVHERYREGLRKANQTSPSLVDFDALPADVREQNRAVVRDLTTRLTGAGYILIPARSDESSSDFSADEVERMAEAEHDHWMKAKINDGWRYGDPRNDEGHIHPDIVLWRQLTPEQLVERYTPEEVAAMGTGELSESAKEKDRIQVRDTPRILAEAGYAMVRVGIPHETLAGDVSLVVGVTGHRALAEPEKVQDGIEKALRHIEARFGQPLTALSSLAKGADQMATERILGRAEARLIVPLPLPVEDYLNDFGSEPSRQKFLDLLEQAERVIDLPSTASREDAYEAAGRYILDHSDVLLVVWDGQGAQGQGGTGAIVVEARGRGLPIIWVHAGNHEPSTEQGLVTLENW